MFRTRTGGCGLLRVRNRKGIPFLAGTVARPTETSQRELSVGSATAPTREAFDRPHPRSELSHSLVAAIDLH
jgi:hypothetical protein